jgi:hypothetical protein
MDRQKAVSALHKALQGLKLRGCDPAVIPVVHHRVVVLEALLREAVRLHLIVKVDALTPEILHQQRTPASRGMKLLLLVTKKEHTNGSVSSRGTQSKDESE